MGYTQGRGVDNPNVRDYGVKGNDSQDETTGLQRFFDESVGKEVKVPYGVYPIEGGVKVRANTTVKCDGHYDTRLELRSGTIFKQVGAGTPSVWTDINPAGDAPIAPLFIFAAPNIQWKGGYFESDIAGARHSAIFVPASERHRITNVSTSTGWGWGLYLDATWSELNTYLHTLHPDVEAGSLQECVVAGNRFRGVIACGIKGTDRDPNDLITYPDWVWSPSGTSDMRFWNNEFRPHTSGGTAFYLNARIRNGASQGQGIWGGGNAYRCASASAMFYFGHINRVEFSQCYGEEIGDLEESKVNIMSTTGSIKLGGRFIKAPIVVDGEVTGVTLDAGNACLPNLIIDHHDGRLSLGTTVRPSTGGLLAYNVGGVASVTVSNGGSGYNPVNTSVVPANGQGYGAKFTPVISSGVITGVTVTAGGTYIATPTLTVVSTSGTGAVVVPVMAAKAAVANLGSSSHSWPVINALGLRNNVGRALVRGELGYDVAPTSSTVRQSQDATTWKVTPDGTTDRLSVSNTLITVGATLAPVTDNTVALGTSSLAFNNVRTYSVQSAADMIIRAAGTINMAPSSGTVRTLLNSTGLTVQPNGTNARLVVSDTAVTTGAPFTAMTYTLGTLPSAASFARAAITVSNSTPINAFCVSNGTVWVDQATGVAVV